MSVALEPFGERLLAWYDRHARDLPWRVPPGSAEAPDPYRVWLSEVMLQQTRVAAVKPYFERFTRRWPTVADLAAAKDEEVMGEWAGLGYYSRARNLKACAEAVAALGGFPDTEDALRELPGIGAYTSASIAAIAFDRRAVVVDGNVERVLTRHRAIDIPMPAARASVRQAANDLTPKERPGDYAQAVMDLGATICTPRNPVCALCPVNGDCKAFAAGDPERYPVKVPRKAKPERVGAVFAAFDPDGAVWLVRRPDRGLLGSMAALPSTNWSAATDGETDARAAPFPAEWKRVGEVRHGFTHFDLTLTVWRADGVVHRRNDGWWAQEGSPDRTALPTLFAKALEVALQAELAV